MPHVTSTREYAAQDRELGRTLRTLLASELFFARRSYRSQVKAPLDYTVGLVRSASARVVENGSLGTDHGAAAPVFVLGGGVRAGLHGRAPSLTDLDDGDVRSAVDFRTVYAGLLSRLAIAPRSVLGNEVACFDLFA